MVDFVVCSLLATFGFSVCSVLVVGGFGVCSLLAADEFGVCSSSSACFSNVANLFCMFAFHSC